MLSQLRLSHYSEHLLKASVTACFGQCLCVQFARANLFEKNTDVNAIRKLERRISEIKTLEGYLKFNAHFDMQIYLGRSLLLSIL